jgi:hypothetical protein
MEELIFRSKSPKVIRDGFEVSILPGLLYKERRFQRRRAKEHAAWLVSLNRDARTLKFQLRRLNKAIFKEMN